MKKMFRLIYTFLVFLVFGTSCQNDDITTFAPNVRDVVADDIAATLRSSNSGLSSEISMVAGLSIGFNAEYKKSAVLDTLNSIDTIITRTNNPGATITYDYTYEMEYGFVTNHSNLNNLYYSGKISGNFENRHLMISDQRHSNWVVTGIEAYPSYYYLNGTTHRTGDTQSKVSGESHLSSDSQITLTNIKINKYSLEIISGTMNWTISGNVNDTPYTYNAAITYLGNYKLELTIDKTIYFVEIASGEI